MHVDDCPGVGSSDRIIDYIKAGIMVQYECVHGPWKKVLGFKFTCTENTVIMSAEHTIETMYNTFLINHPKYDARLPGRDVKLTAGDAPAGNDPRLFAYLEMNSLRHHDLQGVHQGCARRACLLRPVHGRC